MHLKTANKIIKGIYKDYMLVKAEGYYFFDTIDGSLDKELHANYCNSIYVNSLKGVTTEMVISWVAEILSPVIYRKLENQNKQL